ncbi:hypothetical protein I4F81_005783 [Pyropia yezoensis]|uniref:Uncharacterized protein n=1 Tax=Pyropia yezoensis TaxID=2788 RepID=A0ACC3BZ82_PYRYE|nr:hypothetical protein I4F81_005783 [Neopyropia yezoensis]
MAAPVTPGAAASVPPPAEAGPVAVPVGDAGGPIVGAGTAMPSVPLAKLVHDSVQAAYKELHALLDSLSDKTSDARKEAVVEYALRTRHRLVRLLVVVRWSMDYGASTSAAAVSGTAAGSHVRSLEAAASALWADVENVEEDIDAMPPAARKRYVLGRVGRATRALLRVASPLPGGLAVAEWQPGGGGGVGSGVAPTFAPASTIGSASDCGSGSVGGDPDAFAATATVGLPEAWTVRLSLDGVDPDTALFRVHEVDVLVDGCADAPGPFSPVAAYARTPSDERAPAAAAGGGAAAATATGLAGASSGGLAVLQTVSTARARAALAALADAMTGGVVAPLLMTHIRGQSAALAAGAWSGGALRVSTGVPPGAPPGTPSSLSLDYWPAHREPCRITFTPVPAAASDVGVFVAAPPPAPGLGLAGAPWTPLVPAQLLVSAGPVEKEPVGGPVGDGGGGSMPLPPSGTTLVIRMRGAHTGLTVRPSCRSGGIRLRVIGAAALAVPPSVAAIPGGKSGAGSSAPGLWSSTNALSADAGVWQGERHFASAADEYAAVATALAGVHRRLQLEAAAHLDVDTASRTLLKIKCEPLPVRRAELLLRGSEAWQVRLELLPPIFDSTLSPLSPSGWPATATGVGAPPVVSPAPAAGAPTGGASTGATEPLGSPWPVGVSCVGSTLTFTYPSPNASSVRSFFRDLTRARTAAALARGVPPSPYYTVLRRSPVRIVVGVGPKRLRPPPNAAPLANGAPAGGARPGAAAPPAGAVVGTKQHDYQATVEYVYSKGNSGGFSVSFSPSLPTLEQLSPLIEETLDASGGGVGGVLAGLLERACPVAAAAEAAVRHGAGGRIRFVTALRGFAHPNGNSGRRNDFTPLPKWDVIVAYLAKKGYARQLRAESTVVLPIDKLENFLSALSRWRRA